MAPGQAGTFVIEGLLEGNLGRTPGREQRLEEWVQTARRAGYRFSLQVEGEGFNLLGDGRAAPSVPLGAAMAEPLRDLLQQLIQALTPPERSDVFSTLRMVEYCEGCEIQTVFTLGPGGVVEARQREVEAPTAPRATPPSVRSRVRAAALAVVILAALLGVTSLFVDWRAVLQRTWHKLTPLDTAVVRLEAGPFSPYLAIEGLETETGGNVLVLRLRRTEAFPRTLQDIEAALAEPGLGLAARGALAALAQGYLRIETFDAQDEFLQTAQVRVAGLRTQEEVSLRMPFKRETPPRRISLTW